MQSAPSPRVIQRLNPDCIRVGLSRRHFLTSVEHAVPYELRCIARAQKLHRPSPSPSSSSIQAEPQLLAPLPCLSSSRIHPAPTRPQHSSNSWSACFLLAPANVCPWLTPQQYCISATHSFGTLPHAQIHTLVPYTIPVYHIRLALPALPCRFTPTRPPARLCISPWISRSVFSSTRPAGSRVSQVTERMTAA